MKTLLFIFVVVVGLTSTQAAAINGVSFRLESNCLVLKEVAVDRYASYQKQDAFLSVLRADYQGTVDSVDFFIREGVGVDMVDPDTPTARVVRFAERRAGDYHIYDVICTEKGIITCGVLIEPDVADTPKPLMRGPGIYIAVRGGNPRQLAAALSMVLGEIQIGLVSMSFKRLSETTAFIGLKELISVLNAQGAANSGAKEATSPTSAK